MESSESKEPPRRPLVYFTPHQMVYLVKHQDDLRDDQLDALINWSNGLAGSARISRRRVLRFPPTPQPKSPEIERTQLSPEKQYIRPKVEPRSPFTLMFADVEGVENSATLVELILRLDDRRGQQPLREVLSLELVSPNWLVSGAPGQDGTGGPGGRPMPFQDGVDTAPYEFHLPEPFKAISPEKEERGKGVKVAILDTAPCLHDLAEAYQRWQEPNSQIRHPLIQTLLGPNGLLHVQPASYDDLLRMASFELDQHRYLMTDHGLFVAGIVHTIARRAELHLIEVLNPYGVGDVESICLGLAGAAQEQYRLMQHGLTQPLVVNCSLVLNVPLDAGHPKVDLDEQLPIGDRQWLERQGWPVEWICDLLYALGSRVVAAAGNDREAKNRPQARYPAALNSALGVGALPRLDSPPRTGGLPTASYSNLSDRPEYIGVTTLGGEPGEGAGVLGLYLGKFPSPYSRRRNTKNWAWWCGTSFATPIISGVTAAVLSGMPSGSTTQEAIEQLYNAEIDKTVDNEDVLFVMQG